MHAAGMDLLAHGLISRPLLKQSIISQRLVARLRVTVTYLDSIRDLSPRRKHHLGAIVDNVGEVAMKDAL